MDCAPVALAGSDRRAGSGRRGRERLGALRGTGPPAPCARAAEDLLGDSSHRVRRPVAGARRAHRSHARRLPQSQARPAPGPPNRLGGLHSPGHDCRELRASPAPGFGQLPVPRTARIDAVRARAVARTWLQFSLPRWFMDKRQAAGAQVDTAGRLRRRLFETQAQLLCQTEVICTAADVLRRTNLRQRRADIPTQRQIARSLKNPRRTHSNQTQLPSPRA